MEVIFTYPKGSFKIDCLSITANTPVGFIKILPNHANMITIIEDGHIVLESSNKEQNILLYNKENKSVEVKIPQNHSMMTFDLQGATLEILDGACTILTNEIDFVK